jgi:hypothetical protein
MKNYSSTILLATEWRQQVAPKRWYHPTYYIHADRDLHTHYVRRQPTALHCPVDYASSQNRRRCNFIAAQIGLHFMSVIYKAPPPPSNSILNFILSQSALPPTSSNRSMSCQFCGVTLFDLSTCFPQPTLWHVSVLTSQCPLQDACFSVPTVSWLHIRTLNASGTRNTHRILRGNVPQYLQTNSRIMPQGRARRFLYHPSQFSP